MFRVLNTSNVENAIYVQGTKTTDAIASLVFKSYDQNMASISLFGTDGYGDIVFKTMHSNLSEKMRISHTGVVNIGDQTSHSNSNSLLNVAGAIHAHGPIQTSELSTSNVTTQSYKTQRVVFSKLTSSNFVDNLVVMLNSNQAQFDAANIISGTFNASLIPSLDASIIATGELSQSVFPSSLILNTISTSNFVALTNTSTPRVSFIKGSNSDGVIATGPHVNIVASNIDAWGSIKAARISIGYPTPGDEIRSFKDFGPWAPETSLSNVTLSVAHSRYGFVNNATTVHFSYVFTLPIQVPVYIDVSLPRPPAYSIAKCILFTDMSGNDVQGKVILDTASGNMHFRSTGLSQGHWSVAESITYESVA